jgi:hypothetical protein
LRRRTAESPFSAAYFVLLDGLGIVPDPGAGDATAGDAGQARVRVDVTTSGEGRS